jgi:hypothetical protein
MRDLRCSRTADGELVDSTLTWKEHSVTYIVRLNHGQVAPDTAFCGGRWPAPLIAEMAAASQAGT